MQTLDDLKAKGQAGLTSLMGSVKERPDDVKVWGVAAGSAVIGAVAVNAAARGVIAILGTLASTPVALTVGAVGGGYLGWTYLQKWQAAEMNETDAAVEPVVETIPVTIAPAAVPSAAVQPFVTEPSTVASAEEVVEVIATDDPVVIESANEEPAAPAAVDTPAPAVPDTLETINGIGPVYASRLQSAGIQSFAQLAELSADQVREIIGSLRSGHMVDPEKWIAEARRLAAGGS